MSRWGRHLHKNQNLLRLLLNSPPSSPPHLFNHHHLLLPGINLSRHYHSPKFTMPAPQQSLAQKSKVLIFGAGNFGSCLADHLGDSQHDVYMWTKEEYVVKHFNVHHRNPGYLKDHFFSENIKALGPEMPNKNFINGMDVLIFAIPTQFLR